MKNKSAFTLIEILVVLGVIGLLAAILVPAVTGGMAKARRMQCLGNVRTVGASLFAYAMDHRNRMPGVGGSGAEFESMTEMAKALFEDGYMENLEAWACPTDKERRACPGSAVDSFDSGKNSSYVYFAGYNPLKAGDVNAMPLLCDRARGGLTAALTDGDNHGAKYRNVVYLGGAATTLKGAAANDVMKTKLPDGVVAKEPK